MTGKESFLVDIAQMKAVANRLFREEKIGEAEYQAINRQLDALLIEEVSGLAEKQPSVLADDLTRRYPNLDLESLTQLLWLGHSDQILGPREEALRAGLPFLDLSEYFPGFDRIPLTPFLWRHVHFEFRNLCQLLANPEVSFDKAVAASRSFFCFEKGLHAPTGFPDLSNRIINRLLNENRILPAQAQALAEDLDTIFACLDENRAHLHQAFFQETIEPAAFFAHGELAFNLLMDRLFAAGPVDEVLLDRLVIQWPGPGFIDLVAPWLKRGREREKAPLILARTGLDPIRQEKAWRDWLQKQNNHEKLRYRLFENNLNAQKTLYETAFVLACGDLLGDKLETIWWPALRPEREEAESVEAIETAALPAEPAPSPEKIEKTEPDSFLPEDDADQLSAPPLTASSEDLLVEKHSAWRSTLKPFLSENWMGMLGAFSLLAAWLFFSLYFWGAGTIFRLLVAGALPLSLFTLGAGLAARLIAHRRDRGASPRAATLFAILCLGSAPFNFMIAYALMGVASPWGFGLGLALGLAQIGIVFLVSKWCRPVFGVSHFRFLLLQSLLLLFPFLAARFGPGWTPLAMNAVLFVAGMILFLEVLGRVKNEDPNYPLNWKMLSGYYLLVLVVMHLYFKATPGPVALSAWLQCLALGIGFFGRGQTSATLVGAGLSVLGNAIAFQAPIGLPLSLALATVFWLRQKKQRETAWLNEVVLVHLAGLALVGLYLGQVSWAWVAPALLPVLLAGVLIERKPGEKEIQLISLGLPFLLAGFVGLTDTETFFTATLLPLTLILATGIYAYVRYVRWFRTGPWLITMLIIPFLGLACMPFPMLSKWTALYMGGAAVLWALVSRRLPDALNRRHGAGLLLFTALAAAAFQFAYLLANPDSPIPVSLGLILTLAAFYVAARRFRSSLPIYLGLGLILVWGQQLRAGWGFHGRSGLATAVCAWLFLAAAAWLDRRKPVAEVESPDLFFNKPFLLQTDRYLAKPMETVALLLAFASLVKTILWFAPFSQNIKLGVALLANIPLFAVLALMRRNRLLGALIAVPALMLLVAAAWSAPLEVRPFYVGLFLLMSTAILDRLEKRERLKPIYSPLKIICQVLVLFSIALGFMAYAFYVQFEGMGLNLPATERGFYAMGYGLMAIVVTHLLVVRRFSGFASHLVLIHILICCCFYHVLFTNGLSVDGLLFRVLASFIGLTALLAYIAEFYRTKASAPYLRAARIWLPAIGFGAASIALAQRFLPQSSPSFLVAAAAYCLLHLANRYGAHRILLLLKSLVAWLFISFFVQDLLLSLMLAILLFSLVEWLLAETNRWPMLRIQGYMLEKADVARRTTLIVALLSVGFLVMHLFVFFAEPRGFLTTPHYLLWILIPYAHYFKRTFGHAFFAYAAIGLFAYATAFIFWGAPLPEAWGLTPLHGLNLGLVLAIGCYDAIGRLSRKRGLTEFANRVENTNVLITSIIIFSATLSFVTAHQLEAPFQARFLVSAVLLGLTASFLRWGPRRIETVHRALYRIATTMMLWSIGLYFAPYQSWILYLILAPGLFFLFRIEVKAAKSQREDLAAAGILFALTVFLFVQLQPLQLLLFPDEAFHWNRYYLDAPVLMIAGLGLMRLHKHATWPGLCLLGSILAAAGAVLTLSGLLHPYLGRYSESLVLAVVAHLGLMVIFIRNPLYRLFVRFTGLRSHERNGYRTQFFWLANIALQANLVFLLLFPTYLWWVMVLLPVCVSGLLYWYKARTLAPAFIETGVLAFPIAFWIFPTIPSLLLVSVLAGLILGYAYLRRTTRFSELLANPPFLILVLLYLVLVVSLDPLSPLGLVMFAVPVIAWIALPGRPFAVSRGRHVLLWPFLSGLIVFCLGEGYRPELLTIWAMVCLIPPTLLLLLLRTRSLRELSARGRWVFLRDWEGTGDRSLRLLIPFSLGICLFDFLLNRSLYTVGWAFSGRALALLAVSALILMAQTIAKPRLKMAFFTEALILAILGFVRWKLAVLEYLALGSPIDGYLFLAAAAVVAGIREVVRNRVPEFESYFNKTAQIYALTGWAITVYLQISSDALHAEIGSVFLALFYFWMSRTREKKYLLPMFLFGNAALLLFFYRLDRSHVSFYLLPSLGSVLVLAQLFKETLGVRRLKMIRLICSLIMLGVTAFYNILDFNASIWYPVTAALVAALGVIAGIAFRVRIYLFMGVAFFLLNTVAALAHVVRNQPPDLTKLAIGVVFLATGILFTGGFLFFQMKRAELLARYQHLRADLESWE